MEKIRKGNDIEIQWAIYAGKGINEAPYDLTGKNVTLYLKNSFGAQEVYEYTIEKHVIRFTFWGKDQKQTGKYSLMLIENEGRPGMHTVDECDAFNLVNHSCETGGESEGRVECVHLQFRANMGVFMPGAGLQMEVDSSLSLESENPVQNKVITASLQKMGDRLGLVEQSLELAEDSIQSLSLKVDAVDSRMAKVEVSSELALLKVEAFDARMTKIEASNDTTLLKVEQFEAKVNELEERVEGMEERVDEVVDKVDTLHADSNTEGSVDNKIATALDWEEITD